MTDLQLPPQMTIWGDFTSPCSALLSLRVDALVAEGLVEVDWRAVWRGRGLDERSEPAGADEEVGRRELAAAFDAVVQRAGPGELLTLRLPRRPPDAWPAVVRYAALDDRDRPTARAKLFDAVWAADLDISSPVVLDMLVPVRPGDDLVAGGERAAAWQAEWQDLDGETVPVAQGFDGRLLRGEECLDALDALR